MFNGCWPSAPWIYDAEYVLDGMSLVAATYSEQVTLSFSCTRACF